MKERLSVMCVMVLMTSMAFGARSWTFDSGNTDWLDQHGTIYGEYGRAFTQVQDGNSDMGFLEVAVNELIASTDDSIKLDLYLWNNPSFPFADLWFVVNTDVSGDAFYKMPIADGVQWSSLGVQVLSFEFKLSDMIPAVPGSNEHFGGPGQPAIPPMPPALAVGDTVKKLRVQVWGYSFGLAVDNVILNVATPIQGDANLDGAVDVGDLGILAANYGGSGKKWKLGDFNGDGLVDVGDLGILAAHYGEGSVQPSMDFNADYAKAFGTTVTDEDTDAADEETGSSVCSTSGLPLVAGLMLMGLMFVKIGE
jgi:hypothetical protein